MMKEQIKEVFPECLEFCGLPLFFVKDTNEKIKCQLVFDENEDWDLKIFNQNESEVGFLAIDQCLLLDSDGKKCDCLVFNDTLVCFVEIKNSQKNKSNARKKAYEQLEKTIQFFRKKINFEEMKQLEARVCLIGVSKKIYPRTDVKSQNQRARFKLLYNTSLTEGNELVFD